MYCPNCGKRIPDDSRFCEFCGADVWEDEPVPQKPRQTSRPKETPRPAQPVRRESPRPVQQVRTAPKKKKRKSRTGLIAATVLICVIVVLLAAGGILYANGTIPRIMTKSRAEKYYADGDYEEAASCYEKLIEMDERDEASYIALAGIYLEMEQPEEAIRVLDFGTGKILHPSSDFEALYQQATEMITGGSDFESLLKLGSEKTSAALSLVSSDVSDFPLVRLYLDVTNQNGEQITLTAPRGALREAVSGGEYVEREVKRIERLEGNQGLNIELVADKSGSMDTRMDQVKQVMREFVNSLDYSSGDQVELISFDSYVMYMCTRTGNAEYLNNGINTMVPTGDTAMYDALYSAVTNAGYQGGARCVIAFTDGIDNASVYNYQDVVSLAQRDSVPIYIIGTDRVEESTLQNIAWSTNGYYWYIDDLADLGVIFDEIYREQKDLYCLEYESDSSQMQYAERTVDLILDDEDIWSELSSSFTPVETLEEVTHASRYEIFASDCSWTEANRECIQKGGHLATITSQDEMNQLVQMAENSGLSYLWIGGYTSVDSSGAFGHWVTGEPFNYACWFPGEPSRNDLDGTPEMYLLLWKIEGNWSWNDERDDPITDMSYFSGNMGYICEYES